MQTIEKKKLSLDMRLLAYPAMATAATMFSAQDAEATAMLDHYNLTSTPLDNDDDCAEFGAPCHILAVDVDGGMAYDVATEKAGDPDWDPEGVDMALFSFTAPKDAPPHRVKDCLGDCRRRIGGYQNRKQPTGHEFFQWRGHR